MMVMMTGTAVLPSCADAHTLAHDMIEVHGAEAATVARDNARAAALGRQPQRAKSWIKVLDLIQRQQSAAKTLPREPDRSPLEPSPQS
jgi:hypothetical protein